ncbi:MAG: hypothetical protein HOV94_39990 [Saccharothrix sp.]|nr:hypothetical protein [Saccharothrix sp.]
MRSEQGGDPRRPADGEAGESVCWLSRVCPECGAIPDGPVPPTCPRCGAAMPEDGNR